MHTTVLDIHQKLNYIKLIHQLLDIHEKFRPCKNIANFVKLVYKCYMIYKFCIH